MIFNHDILDIVQIQFDTIKASEYIFHKGIAYKITNTFMKYKEDNGKLSEESWIDVELSGRYSKKAAAKKFKTKKSFSIGIGMIPLFYIGRGEK